MTHRYIAFAFTLLSAVALAAWVAGYWTPMTMYHSTDRHSLRLQSQGGRLALLYDGDAEEFSPRNGTVNFIGFTYSAKQVTGWQYLELSGPGWLIALLPGVYPTVLAFRGPLRRRRRRKRGECVTCGYSLTGNVSGVCSECGEAMGGC